MVEVPDEITASLWELFALVARDCAHRAGRPELWCCDTVSPAERGQCPQHQLLCDDAFLAGLVLGRRRAARYRQGEFGDA